MKNESKVVVMMVNVSNILLTDAEMEQCREFSRRSASSQQAIEFGQDTTKARSLGEIARDNLIGKIAEVAFHKMMGENYGLDVPLDFNYYPRGQWDRQDAEINGWRIDVKGTRKGGRWMLIEWNKLDFRQQEDRLSHLYVMFSVGWDREHDLPTGQACYQGTVCLDRLVKEHPDTVVLRKGSVLPGTNTRLQADNYGIPFKDLDKNLDNMVKYISHNPPPLSLTYNYKNPYT